MSQNLTSKPRTPPVLSQDDMEFIVQARRGKSELFVLCREVLRAEYGDPKTSTAGDIKREWFELEDGRVIMFATPLRKPERERLK